MTETVMVAGIESAVVIVGILGVSIGLRARQYQRAFRRIDSSEEYLPDRYQPMARLLSRADDEFLQRNIRCAKLRAKWERTQRRIARLYLVDLAADFRKLHRDARKFIAQAPAEDADLVAKLLRQNRVFWRAVIWIEVRLAVASLGLPAPRIDFGPLVARMEAMARSNAGSAAAA